ncbi:MAG TPA: AAA family ATPase [Longimicrobium sp.]|nr:AAA family ATPase [Longimicrobium sp.]
MSQPSDRLRALREAVRIAPDDAALRRLLGDAMLQDGAAEEAEAEFRAALRLDPEDRSARMGLVQAFRAQQKLSAALVVLEEEARAGRGGAEVQLLLARLLLETGETARARLVYEAAVARDPASADVELAARLGGVRNGPAEERKPARDPYRDDDDEDDEDDDDDSLVRVERPTVSFRDVGGMDALKEQIGIKIIHPIKHPEMYRAYGKPIGGGILMYGPPGCGKTHLARATAGEVDATFISVGIHEVLDMWIGKSEQNLAELFAKARRQAPCVLFFDEVDALASRRSDFRTSAGRPLINQFLSEMDGIDGGNEGLLVLAATNAPWHLDPAFRRPGRFDRVLFVPPPDAPARTAILEILCRGKPAERLDFDKVARKTDGFSGADLKAVVDLAIERKLADAIRTGRPVPITTDDLLKSAKEVRPSTREWFATARNYVMYANEGGLYDDVKPWLA